MVVTAGGALTSPRSVQVVQRGSPVLIVMPSIQTVGSVSSEAVFAITNSGGSPLTYRASVTSAWMDIIGEAEGLNGGILTIFCVSHPDDGPRTGTVVVAAAGAIGNPKTVLVVQRVRR